MMKLPRILRRILLLAVLPTTVWLIWYNIRLESGSSFLCTSVEIKAGTKGCPPRIDSLGNVTYSLARDQSTITSLQPIKQLKLQKGYVVGWNYYEGLTCASRNLLGLQHWAAKSLDMDVVEPFVWKSFFMMSSNLSALLRFSDYFDMNYWNEQVSKNDYGRPLVSWETFVKSSTRQIIVVYIMINEKDSSKFYVNENIHPREPDCLGGSSRFAGLGEQFNATFGQLGFHVVRRVCFLFNVKSPLSVNQFNQLIFGDYNSTDVSVLFTFWPGVFPSRVHLTPPSFNHGRAESFLKPSPRVIRDAFKYMEMFFDNKEYFAVSLRTVHFGMDFVGKYSKTKEYLAQFLNNCTKLVSQTLKHENMPGRPFLTLDLGRFGDRLSKRYMSPHTINSFISDMVGIVYNNGWSLQDWENSFLKVTDGISDAGYIASVQKTIVSHAKYAVVGGSGHFQTSLRMAFNKSSSNTNHSIIHVCPDPFKS